MPLRAYPRPASRGTEAMNLAEDCPILNKRIWKFVPHFHKNVLQYW